MSEDRLIASAKDVMLSPVSVCLFVCLLVCVLTGLLKNY